MISKKFYSKNTLGFILIFLFSTICIYACGVSRDDDDSKYRILISTDIGGTDPDDNQSMAHLLMYSNEFNIEGLVSSPSYGDGSISEVFRMIDLFEKDLPKLKNEIDDYPSPEYLRSVVKQGQRGSAPYCGYSSPTEGSDWIIKCARKDSDKPLWVLVWGGLDDLAQALHDAPDIKDKIKVYWIGGPNKKWSVDSYVYIAENFPDLWIIESNSSYRGFISNYKKMDEFNGLYYDTYIKGNGYLGDDFFNYLEGNIKMGDTPTLLYLMDGNPENPMEESWGGSFVSFNQSPRIVFDGLTTAKDTAQVYSIMEFRIKGPDVDIPSDSACIFLTINKQTWNGYYMGNGEYVVRHSTYTLGTHPYVIKSDIPDFSVFEGEITISNEWPGIKRDTDYKLGENWYTDRSDEDLFERNYHGYKSVSKWRIDVMSDWAKRWSWLK